MPLATKSRFKCVVAEQKKHAVHYYFVAVVVDISTTTYLIKIKLCNMMYHTGDSSNVRFCLRYHFSKKFEKNNTFFVVATTEKKFLNTNNNQSIGFKRQKSGLLLFHYMINILTTKKRHNRRIFAVMTVERCPWRKNSVQYGIKAEPIIGATTRLRQQ